MKELKTLPAPLFRDPIYDGATDPVVIWNREELCWWMFYTQRRSSDISIGVSNIHGTKIGIASSQDAQKWLYRGTLPNMDYEPGLNTFWAPEVIFAEGRYHMYVSYITGVPTDWNYKRHILHYTAKNMWEWKFESILDLSSDHVIDACVYEVEPHLYKMWYKDEKNNSYTYSAISKDLYHWEVLGAEITDCAHEGPNVFEFGAIKWMITDCWDGLAVYKSDDFTNWCRWGENLLQMPGTRKDDTAMGNHADILVHGEKAFIFYFVQPEFTKEMRDNHNIIMTYKEAKASIQVAELKVEDGELICNRNQESYFELN